jgi:hypothetical protein
MPIPSQGIAVSAYSPEWGAGAKVYGENIQSGVITSAHIAGGTIPTTDIKDGAVTSAKIGTGAVTSVKLGAAAVISAKIGTGAVLASHIGAGAVTSAKIGTGAVVAGTIGALAVTSAKIANSGVPKAKLNCAVITGSILCANVVYDKANSLAKVPTVVIITPWYAVDQAKNFTSGVVVSESAASAATSANFYVIGNKAGAKFKAFLLI